MTSPLQVLKNATLTFNLPIAGTTIDSLGNVICNTETITIECYLKENMPSGGSEIFGNEIQGSAVAQNSRVMSGRAISPMLIDLRIDAGSEGIVAWGSSPAATCRVVRCRYAHGTSGLGSIIRPIIGDAIQIIMFDRI